MSAISQIAETLARPGVLGLVGKRLENRTQSELRVYFDALGKRIVALGLENLVEEMSAQMARHAVDMKMQNVLRVFTPTIKGILSSNMEEAMHKADKINSFAEAIGDVIPDDLQTMLSSDEAALWASIRAGELVTGINDTTRSLIADAIEEGISEALGVPGTARLIRATVADMTRLRSEMIASTEINRAMSEAALRKMNRIGLDYKQWIVSTACCDVCAENQDASPLPVNDLFPSGDMYPPAHPNCRCAVSGARAPEDETIQ